MSANSATMWTSVARHRRSLVDITWPFALLLVAIVAIAFSEFGFDSDSSLTAILQTAFGIAIVYQLASLGLGAVRVESLARSGHMLLNAVAVAALGMLWWMFGGLNAPSIAFFFALPIFALGLINQTWLYYGMTAWAVLVIWVVALLGSLPLRWQLETYGYAELLQWMPLIDSTMVPVSVDGEEQLRFMLVLTTFLIGVSVTTKTCVEFYTQIYDRLYDLGEDIDRGSKLLGAYLEQHDGRVFFLDLGRRRVIAASARLERELGFARGDGAGQYFERCLPFIGKKAIVRKIEKMKSGETAKLRYQIYQPDETPVLAHVRLAAVEVDDNVFVRVSIMEQVGSTLGSLVADTMDFAVGVLDAKGNVLFRSEAARALAPSVAKNDHADLWQLPAGWWQIAPRSKHTRYLSFGKRKYEVKIVRREFFGDAAEFVVFQFHLER